MCLLKIIKTEYVEEQFQPSDRPIKANTLNGKKRDIEQVLSGQPRIETKYYLFGVLLVCKLVHIKRKEHIKYAYKVLD